MWLPGSLHSKCRSTWSTYFHNHHSPLQGFLHYLLYKFCIIFQNIFKKFQISSQWHVKISCLGKNPYLFSGNKDIGGISWEIYNGLGFTVIRPPNSQWQLKPVGDFTQVNLCSATRRSKPSVQLTSMCCQYSRLFWSSGCWINSRDSHSGNMMFFLRKKNTPYAQISLAQPSHMTTSILKD